LPASEKALIAGLRGQASIGRGVLKGIGDDCAVLRIPPDHETLVTTDFSLEGIHFRREWHSPEFIGHRCLTRGLSDIAAMGGVPIAAFLSLALPPKLPQAWVNRFMKGLLSLACQHKVTLAGGDTAQSPSGVLADIIVMGSVPRGKAILRSGAKPGDAIYVTGSLGASAAWLKELVQGHNPRRMPHSLFPQPRLQTAQYLRQKHLATAMIDLSDGLSTDLSHICEESSVGAELWQDAIPRATVKKSNVALEAALHGGDDYELLFTAPERKTVPNQIAGVPIKKIGRIIRGAKMFLLNESGRKRLSPEGWQHFK
jgi:thiamine-monophosphate kinase